MPSRGFTGVISALLRHNRTFEDLALVQDSCLVCDTSLTDAPLYRSAGICPECRFHYSVPARQRVRLLADPRSFKERFRSVKSTDPLLFNSRDTYRTALADAQQRTGMKTAALVGQCTIEGVPAVVMALDFSFLGSSMGLAVGEKAALACEHAARRGLPLVALLTSGGTRLQEGALSLMQMAKVATAVSALHRKGLPYIAICANPTTGQVYAGFANMADVLMAEPGALIGFAPLRSLQEAAGATLPEGAHTAESHLQLGMLDKVVDREETREAVAAILRRLAPARPRPRRHTAPAQPRPLRAPLGAWEAVQRTRRPDRPTARDYIGRVFDEFVELHGDRLSADDPAIVCGLGNLQGASVMVVAQQRLPSAGGDLQPPHIGPEALRKAQRAMNLAATFRIPIVTLVDCAGPATTLAAEEGGLGNALANTIFTMANLPAPTVAAIIGEGGRESALALSIADQVLMQESAIYAPASPEAAAALLYRDDARAPDAAQSMRLTASDMRELRIVDTVVAEPREGAHADPTAAAAALREALVTAVQSVASVQSSKRLAQRHKRYRMKGETADAYQRHLARELQRSGQPTPRPRRRSAARRNAAPVAGTEVLEFPGADTAPVNAAPANESGTPAT